LGYGMGVMRMMLPFQDEVTEQHCDRLASQKINNMSIFRARAGLVPGGNLLIFHGKVIDANKDDIERFDLGRSTMEATQSEQVSIMLAERRVGTAEISSPRPSQMFGNRTPGITALTAMQQANRRFTPAFDDIRFAVANGHMQCAYRYREQILAGNAAAAQNILRVMGPEDARRVINVLLSDHFEDGVNVEMTASSVSVNQEADRQNMLAIISTLGPYYQQALQLVQLASTPGQPEPVIQVSIRIAQAVSELLDRVLRTWPTMKDPQTFIVEMEDILDSLPLQPEGLNGLGALIQQVAGGGGGQAQQALPPPAGA
jgi:hypothetical protein